MAKKITKTPPPDIAKNTLWEATVMTPGFAKSKQTFLFREIDDFAAASKEAIRIANASPAITMINAEILGVERKAHLWN